jgi:hypothetical protein
MPQTRDGKGEAVLKYCEPLPTKKMGHHRAFPKGEKQGVLMMSVDFTFGEFPNNYYIS